MSPFDKIAYFLFRLTLLLLFVIGLIRMILGELHL